MRWLVAVGIVVAGVVLGSVVSAQVRRLLSAAKRGEHVRDLAEPFGSVAFSVVLAAALFAGLGYADPKSLETLPDSLIAFLPKALLCALTILLGKAAATIVAGAVGSALLRSTGKPQHQVTRVVRSVVFAVAVILGVSQLGVNTKVVDTLVDGLIFGTALSVALLTAFGGRRIAADVAAGRYLKRVVQIGDVVQSGSDIGRVVALNGATVELERVGDTDASTDSVTIVHVPNQALLDSTFSITRRRNDRHY